MDWEHDQPSEVGEDEGWELQVETCRIVLWRAYLTSSFYAQRSGDPPATSVVDPSSAFRWRRSSAPDADAARRAHREVVARLEDDGWIPTGRGSEWYETEFARRVLVPSPTPAAEAGHDAPAPAPEPEPQAVTVPLPLQPRLAPPIPASSEAAPRPRRDRWRATATTGLIAAIAFLGWVATHPSVVGAVAHPSLTSAGPAHRT